MLLSSWSLASNNKIKHKSQTDEQNNEKKWNAQQWKRRSLLKNFIHMTKDSNHLEILANSENQTPQGHSSLI